MKAVLTIITKLSDRTINGELLKHLAKTSNDEQPGIRTNTTICLGKIARNLGTNVYISCISSSSQMLTRPKTRQKVLVAAFSRSLRDPFIHARNAALLALAATTDLFNGDDCASKILPALCPSLIDRERYVMVCDKRIGGDLQKSELFATKLTNALMSTFNGSENMEALCQILSYHPRIRHV